MVRTVRNSNPFRMGAARYQRKHPSTAERLLWQALRRKNSGFRFRRQYAVKQYILDFYCHAALLCIEIDGPLHDVEAESARDEALAELDILTVRIEAQDLLERPEFWFEGIKRACERRVAQRKRLLSGAPPP